MTLREQSIFNLTPRQWAFCEHYIELKGDGPEAAMRAYNCSDRVAARVTAHRNLNNPKVLAFLEQMLQWKTITPE